MNKLKIYLLFVIGLGLVFLFSAKEIFSQDSRNIQLFRPSSQVQRSSESELIEQWAEHYKKSYGINSLYAYKAAVLNSPSACSVADDLRSCREEMDVLVVLSNLAIGRCEVLTGFDREVCIGLKKRDCSGLKEFEGLVCQSFLDLDPGILEGKPSIIRGGVYGKQDVYATNQAIAFYSAFKNGNMTSCMQIIGDDAYVYKLGCRILVSPEPQRVIDAIALDFAHYYYLDSNNEKNACGDIRDEYVRRYCKQNVSISQFVDKYFLGD